MLGRYILTAVDFMTVVSLGLVSSITIVLAVQLFPLLSWKFFFACSSLFIFFQAVFLAVEHIGVEMAYKGAHIVITEPTGPAPEDSAISAAIPIPLCLTGIWQCAIGIWVLGSLADPLFSPGRIGKPISVLIEAVAIIACVTGGLKFLALLFTRHLVSHELSTVDDAKTLVENESDINFGPVIKEKDFDDSESASQAQNQKQPFYHSFEERSRYLSLLTKLYKVEKERN